MRCPLSPFCWCPSCVQTVVNGQLRFSFCATGTIKTVWDLWACWAQNFTLVALLLPSPLTYPLLWMKRDWERGRESEDDDIQYKMLSPIELLWKAPFLSVYTEADAFENMFMSYGVSFIPAFSHTCSTYTPIQCVHWKIIYFLPFHASYNMIPSWSVLNRLTMSENQFDQNVFCCVKQWSILFSVISFCYFCQTTVINF